MYKRENKSRRSTYRQTNMKVECSLNADIDKSSNGIRMIASGTVCSPTVIEYRPKTAWEFYQNAPPWQKKNWGNAPITEVIINQLQRELTNDYLDCSGDGSVLHGRAAHAWCIFKKSDHKIIISGSASVYGEYRDTNSLRPESFGCIAAFSLLHLISSSMEEVSANVTYHVDNDTTVTNSKRTFLHDTTRLL